MFHIRKLRTYRPKGLSEATSETRVKECTVETIEEIFTGAEELVNLIAPEERYNILYTIGESIEAEKRRWVKQTVIPFDLDGLVNEDGHFDEKKVIEETFAVLGVDPLKCVIVATGNGMQILIKIKGEITSRDFFTKYRAAYKNLAKRIEARLREKNIKIKEVDTSCFSPNRLFRMPLTKNIKPNLPEREARILNRHLEPQDFFIQPTDEDHFAPKENEFLNDDEMKFKIDSESVEAGCRFLRWAKENPMDVTEPQWYAMLSVVARLEDGKKKCHEYSAGHPSYSPEGTDNKIEQALSSAGPRTCQNIDSLWGGCSECPFNKKVNSPVSIRGERFIATRETGFYTYGKNNKATPDYEGLRKYCELLHNYKTNAQTGGAYFWNGKKYEPVGRLTVHAFAQTAFDPKPISFYCEEFANALKRTNQVPPAFFYQRGKINFQNGVLDLKTKVLSPHDPDVGFLYVLPYDYDPAARAPVFENFVDQIMCGDTTLAARMLEYCGNAIIDITYDLQALMILIGEGSNGKTTFLNVLRLVAGSENMSYLSVPDFSNERNLSLMEGKLLNLCDELPASFFKNTDIIKKLTGGMMTMRRLYQDAQTIENGTKMIFSGNELPATADLSHGFMRRLVIIPFRAHFSPSGEDGYKADPRILDKMKAELAGIFNVLMRHYEKFLARGKILTESEQSTAELENYRDDNDTVGRWFKETIQVHADFNPESCFVEKTMLWEKYHSHCRSSEERPVTAYKFFNTMKRLVPKYEKRIFRTRKADRKRCVLGLEFKSDAPGQDLPF